LGKALPPHACTDDSVGRVLDRLYDFGTMRLFTACAVRAATRFGLERRYVHLDTTSRSVWGDYQFAETQDLPLQVTYGYSKEKRPDLKQFVWSTLCVDRAVPIWGKCDDGNASDKALNTTLFSEIAHLLAQYGVQPGAYSYIADAALGIYPSWGSDGIAAEMRYAFGVIRHVLQKRSLPDAMPDGQHTSG
jgi:transposase